MDEDDIIIIDEGLEPDEDTDPEEEYDDSSDLSEYEDSVYTDDVILALFESTDEEDSEDEDTENNDLEDDDISLNDAESDELNYYDNVPIDEYDSENNEDDDDESEDEEESEDESEDEEESEDESEDEEESDESDYIINDNIATVPTIANVSAGDRVMVVLKNGEPTVVGAAGSGDIFSENLEETVSRLGDIEVDNLEVKGRLSAAEGNITTLTSSKADITDLTAATARIETLETDNANVKGRLSAAEGNITSLTSSKANITDLTAATARIGDLEADHVSVSDFEAEQANIDQLQADTADIDEIRANSAKVENLTAAQLEADHATVGSLSTTYATIANLNAATGRISDLESTRVRTTDLEANYITADAIDAAYTKTDLSNTDVAWIQNGTIKNGAITNAMINSVSANKLTAGTIDASVINVTNLQADDISVTRINGQTVSGKTLVDALEQHEDDISDLDDKIDTQVEALNDRIDGAIETFTGTAVPTLTNSPASSWNTTKLKDQHVGDVYYVVNSDSQQNGYCYRFTKSGSSYSWQLIKDSDVTAALGRLQTAEGKISTIEQFDSDISSWKTDTDDELASIKSNHTVLVGRVDDAESSLATKVETSTFNTLSQTVEENSASISQLTTETTTLTSKVETQNPFIIGTQTAQTGSWTGNASMLSSLVDGQQITYWLPFAGSGNASLNLTLKDGTTTGAIPCYYGGTSRLTTHYGANNAIHLTYRTNVSNIAQGWWADANYDTNTTYSKYSDTVVAGKNGLKRYTLCMRDDVGNFTSIVNQANNINASGKTCYTGGLQLGSVCYHWTGGEYAAGANAGVIWESYGGVDFRYSTNGVTNAAATTELQLRKPVYLVGTIGTDGLFYLDTTKWWTQTSFVEDKAYVFVGTAYSSYYAIFVAVENPTYIYEDGELVEIQTLQINKTTTKVNTVSDTVDEHTRKIGVLETSVESKADGSTVETMSTKLNTVSDTVDGHTQSISSINSTLSTKADSSTVSTLSTKVNTIEDTVDGHTQSLQSVTSTQTSIQQNAVKSTVQLWFTKANTSAPSKPTAHITVNDATKANQWNLAVPNYNATYPNYYYCYEYQYLDGSYGWSAVTRDIATGEMQERARTAITNAANAQADIDGLEIGGRNLYIRSTSVPGYLTGSGGNIATQSTSEHERTSDFIPVVAGESYILQTWYDRPEGDTTHYQWICVGTFDASKTQVGQIIRDHISVDTDYKSYSITPATGVAYIRISARRQEDTDWLQRVKFEKGTKPTDWTPAPEDVDADISTAQTAADTAQVTADKNVKESIQLWITKASSSTPAKPTSKVTSTAVSGNAWTTKVPTYNSTYPYYFYCMQYVAADGTVTWSDVVYDQATTEAQSVARTATTNLSTLQQDYATFKQTTQNFESTIGSTYATKIEVSTVQTNLDNLEIGGRNLLRGTEKCDASNWYLYNSTVPEPGIIRITPTSSTAYGCYTVNYLDYSEYNDSVYTFSFDVRRLNGSYTDKRLRIIYGFNTAGRIGQGFSSTKGDESDRFGSTYISSDLINTNWTRLSVTFAVPTDLNQGSANALIAGSQLTIEPYLEASGNPVEIRRIKLEKGNRATDWTPAPEDVDADISSIESRVTSAETSITQNNEAIALKANASDVYTKSQTDGLISTEVTDRNSAIEQSASAINLSVSQTYSTKTEATQMAQPNLSPFFTMDPTDVYNAITNPDGYWDVNKAFGSGANVVEQLTDGWAHIDFTNNGSGNTWLTVYEHCAWRHRAGDLKGSTKYTVMFEFRNVVKNGNVTCIGTTQHATSWSSMFIGNSDKGSVAVADGVQYHVGTTIEDPSSLTGNKCTTRTLITFPAGSSLNADFRISLYEGEYSGPYKPYNSNVLYATNTNLEAAKASIKVTTDGISSEVSKISSIKHLTSSYASWTLANLKSYATDGQSTTFNVTSTANVRVGDTVYIKGTDSTRNCPVYIKATVTAINSATQLVAIGHGYSDALPVDSAISSINQSAETIKIQASRVEIDGTAIFNSISSDVDSAITDKGYATTSQAQGYATTAKNEAISAAASDATSKANTAKSEAISAAASDATSKANTAKSEAISAAASDATTKANAVQTNLDNLEIGGRNLLQYKVYNYANSNSAVGTGSSAYRGMYCAITGGETYTISRKVVEGNRFWIDWSEQEPASGVSLHALSRDNTALKVTVDIPSEANWLFIYLSNQGDEIHDGNIKVERGTKATDWTPAPEDVNAAIGEKADATDSTEYIIGTQTSQTGSWTGVTRDSSLYTGKKIAYKLPVAGSGNASLQLKDSSGTNVGGNIAVYLGTTRMTTHFGAGSVIQMVYDGTYWRATSIPNTNNYDRRLHNNYVKAASNLTRYSICVGTSAGYHSVVAGLQFDLAYPILYLNANNASGQTYAVASGAQTAAMYEAIPSVTVTYTGTPQSPTANAMLYLKGTLNNSLFTIASSDYLTTVVPTAATNPIEVYIPLGIFANGSTTAIYFSSSKDMYAFVDGQFRQVNPTDVVATQKIYYRTASTTTPTAPTSWITTNNAATYNAWNLAVPPLAANKNEGSTKYAYLYSCEQRQRLDGTVGCGSVSLDSNATIIDGGQIITNSITALQIAANSITATEIDATNLHVSAANVDGTLTIGKVDGLQTALTNLDNLEIGGKNLLRNTRTPVAANYALVRSTVTDGIVTITPTTSAAYAKQKVNYLDYDDYGTGTYTASCDVRLSSAETTYTNKDFRIYYGFSSASHINSAFSSSYDRYSSTLISDDDLTYDWKRVSVTFEVPTDLITGKTAALVSGSHLSVEPYVAGSSIPVEVRFLKLERGSKATDWTPAPEDAEADISEVQTLASTTSANLTTEINQRKATYGTCDTAAATAAKAVTCSNFALYVGAQITVRFKYGNTAAQPTLSVNGTTATAVEVMNNSQPTASMVKWPAYSNCTFTYDGTYWRFTGSDYDQTTATNYITADDTGISIHMSGNSTTYQRQTATGTTFYVNDKKRSIIGADGLHVYVESTETEVASFTSDGAVIGKESSGHTSVTSDGMMVYGSDGTTQLAEMGRVFQVCTPERMSALKIDSSGAIGVGRIGIALDIPIKMTVTTSGAPTFTNHLSLDLTGIKQLVDSIIDVEYTVEYSTFAGTVLKTEHMTFIYGTSESKYMFDGGNEGTFAYSYVRLDYDGSDGITCEWFSQSRTGGNVYWRKFCIIGYSHSCEVSLPIYAIGSRVYKDVPDNDNGFSAIIGRSLIASSPDQLVTGHYNTEDSSGTYTLIIGNGTADNARSNAFTVDWSGNVVAAGTMTASMQIGTMTLNTTNCTLSTDYCKAWHNGVVATVQLGIFTLNNALANGSTVAVGTVPSGYRPVGRIYANVGCALSGVTGLLVAYIGSDGTVSLVNRSGASLSTSVGIVITATYCI